MDLATIIKMVQYAPHKVLFVQSSYKLILHAEIKKPLINQIPSLKYTTNTLTTL